MIKYIEVASIGNEFTVPLSVGSQRQFQEFYQPPPQPFKLV
jgi:hypothetical protein